VRPLDHSVRTRFGYHVLWPDGGEPAEAAAAFRDWALEECRQQVLHRAD